MDDLFTFHDPTPSGLRGRSGTTKPRTFSIGRMRPGALLAYDAAAGLTSPVTSTAAAPAGAQR